MYCTARSAASRLWLSRSVAISLTAVVTPRSLPRSPVLAVAPDQRSRRAIVRRPGPVRRRPGRALQLGDDALGERLAQLDAPLIERIHVPDDALGEDAVLVEGHE